MSDTPTTITTLTTVVPTEFIEQTVIAAAYPFNVVAPLVLNKIQPHNEGVVMSLPKMPTVTAASVTETSDIEAAARTTTEANITVAEVGEATQLTLLAQETAKVANDVLTWAAAQAQAIAQKVTGDLCALFPALGGSSAVGSTGVNITIANFITAMYTLDNANAPGQKVSVLHPIQVSDLYTAIVAATGTVYHNLPELIREGRLPQGTPAAGFAGELFGVPIYSTTEVDTANSSADRAGAMFTKEAMGIAQLRPITVHLDGSTARFLKITSHAAYGVAEVVDAYGVSLVTDA